MSNCDNFTKTKKVGKCGSKVWLGTIAGLTGDELIKVVYYLNGDEVDELSDPIIDGDNISLDLTDPYIDFYNPYNTYYISVIDSSGYFSDEVQVTNGGELHDGFIVTFGNATTTNDELIVV